MRGQFMASHDAHNLNALFVKKTNKPRKYSYRLGLYLIVEALVANARSNALQLRYITAALDKCFINPASIPRARFNPLHFFNFSVLLFFCLFKNDLYFV